MHDWIVRMSARLPFSCGQIAACNAASGFPRETIQVKLKMGILSITNDPGPRFSPRECRRSLYRDSSLNHLLNDSSPQFGFATEIPVRLVKKWKLITSFACGNLLLHACTHQFLSTGRIQGCSPSSEDYPLLPDYRAWTKSLDLQVRQEH
jgi:hypothetical protein